jgi:Ni/Fe-hydrogenase subunit HybB-like protein
MSRVAKFKRILWAITGLGLAIAAARMIFGLGATTNLSDGIPWGLWIGFDVMGGVALAAGGFVVTATVYIFKREEFHPIVRPAVLTAFLGYIAVIIGLLFDLGLPWHIWRPMVNWQHHSVLFEVAWCVMLYTTVLALEFSPVPLESTSRYAKIRTLLIKIRFPLVVVGIALSTLHQSSLGSLFLIMPYRLHPLWYSPILPVLFFVSAIGLGLMMVSFESLTTSYLYRKKTEGHLISKLGIGARWVLLLYLAIKLIDLGVRGKLGFMFGSEWQVRLFWIEILFSALLPVVLLFIPKVRESTAGQWTIASIAVTGFVLNRIAVGGLAQIKIGAPFYLPSWGEVAVSAGVVSAAILIFLFAIEHLNVWEKPPKADSWQNIRSTIRDAKFWARLPRRLKPDDSLAFVLAAGIGFAMISGESSSSKGMDRTPVHRARGGDTLWIDGNIDGFGAVLTHQSHMKGCFRGPDCLSCHSDEPTFPDNHQVGQSASDPTCVRCHHMNLPRDRNTACATCHRDMYLSTDAFGHVWHSSRNGANLTCADCHKKGEIKSTENTKHCSDCHADLVPAGSTIKFSHYQALGYVEAMHRLCIECHHTMAEVVENPNLARCATCHPGQRDFIDAADVATKVRQRVGKRVVLPFLGEK